MADIQTPEDWWNVAEKTIPQLPSYAAEFRPVDGLVLETLLRDSFMARNQNELHRHLQDVYDFLPDDPSIRKAPFFDLCDLCSEVWVFDDGLDTETQS